MPNYKFRYQDKVYTVSGNRPPTKEDAQRIATAQTERAINLAPKNDLETASNVSQVLQREEAAVATPLLEAVQKAKPVLGREKPTRSFTEAIGAGASGSTFSPFDNSRQVELGDVLREVGVPEPLAATGGLIASSVMTPSGLATSGLMPLAKKGGKLVMTALGEASKKVARSGLKKLMTTGSANQLPTTFRNVMRTTERLAPQERVALSEFVESMTGVDSPLVLYAFNNPQALKRDLAEEGVLSDIASRARKEIKAQKAGGARFTFDESGFDDLGKSVAEKFNLMVENAGKNVGSVKRKIINQTTQTGKERFFLSSELDDLVDDLLKKNNAIDTNGKLIKGAGNKKEVEALLEIKKMISDIGDVPPNVILGADGQPYNIAATKIKKLDINKALLLKDALDDIGFKPAFSANTEGGITKPLPAVQAMSRTVRGKLQEMIEREYKDFPELKAELDKFSKLADLRSRVGVNLKDSKKTAKFLRNYSKMKVDSPEDILDFEEMLSKIDGGANDLASLNLMNNAKANSPDSVFKFLGSESDQDLESGFLGLFKKKLGDFTDSESNLLSKILPSSLIKDIVEHNVSKAFSKKANFFRALAAGGAFGLFGAPQDAFSKLFAGFLTTDPRFAGMAIRNVNGIKSAFTSLGRAVSSAEKLSRPVTAGLLRRVVAKPEE